MTAPNVGMPTASDEQESMVLDTVDRFLDREVRPHARALEAADEYPEDMVAAMAELGFFGLTIGPEFGGMGLSAVSYSKVVERIAAVWMSVTGFFNAHLMMAQAVERHGSDNMKTSYLPRFVTGELRGGIALTEPGCGTDLQAIRTRARRDNEGFVVDGNKMWITNSVHGNILAVLVKTDMDATPPHRGMSLLLVEKGPGFEAVRKLEKLGYRGIDTGEIVFENCKVPAENLIGDEGRGMQIILGGLELGRINVAARGAGMARACLQESLSYAQNRQTFGQPIAEHQAIQAKLADMATRARAAWLLVEDAARTYDEGGRADLEAGMAKLFATEAAMENSAEALRVHGAYGYSKEYDVERFYRDAPLLAIGEGTNEIQRIVISRQLVKRHPA